MKLSANVISKLVRGRSLRYCLPALLVGGLAWGQDSEAITRIEVVGAQKLTPETVIFKSGLKVGDDLRAVDLTAVLQQLWGSGSFDDIKFEFAEEAGGKKLIIRVDSVCEVSAFISCALVCIQLSALSPVSRPMRVATTSAPKISRTVTSMTVMPPGRSSSDCVCL